MGNFQKLEVWQKAKQLAVDIYEITAESKQLSVDYGLKNQMRRASVSVPSNIAEGDELQSTKQAIRFFYIAKGSIAELITQLIIAEEIGDVPKVQASHLINAYSLLSARLLKLIKARKRFLTK